MGWFVETCCQCKTQFCITDDFRKVAMERCETFQFYCPHGHPQHYVRGESELEKIRRERDQFKQQIAERDDALREAHDKTSRIVAAARGEITKMKKRAHAGMCPCCNRSFANMARHMKQKHPAFDPSKTEFEATH